MKRIRRQNEKKKEEREIYKLRKIKRQHEENEKKGWKTGGEYRETENRKKGERKKERKTTGVVDNVNIKMEAKTE